MAIRRRLRLLSTLLALCALAIVACVVGLRSTGRAANSPALVMYHPDDASKQVEYFVRTPDGVGPWPTVVLLHGHQAVLRPGGRVFDEWGVLERLASRGYLAVAVSQPGYGGSSGPADFCGSWTQRAVGGVIARLRADRLASPDKLLVQGVSRGALTAGLLAAGDPSVSGLVLISAIHDLRSYVEHAPPSGIRRAIARNVEAETGGSSDELEARSIVRRANQIKANTLIISGARDERTDPEQARLLAKRIERAGGRAQVIVYPHLGHEIPVAERNQHIDPFIDRVLRGH